MMYINHNSFNSADLLTTGQLHQLNMMHNSTAVVNPAGLTFFSSHQPATASLNTNNAALSATSTAYKSPTSYTAPQNNTTNAHLYTFNQFNPNSTILTSRNTNLNGSSNANSTNPTQLASSGFYVTNNNILTNVRSTSTSSSLSTASSTSVSPSNNTNNSCTKPPTPNLTNNIAASATNSSSSLPSASTSPTSLLSSTNKSSLLTSNCSTSQLFNSTTSQNTSTTNNTNKSISNLYPFNFAYYNHPSSFVSFPAPNKQTCNNIHNQQLLNTAQPTNCSNTSLNSSTTTLSTASAIPNINSSPNLNNFSTINDSNYGLNILQTPKATDISAMMVGGIPTTPLNNDPASLNKLINLNNPNPIYLLNPTKSNHSTSSRYYSGQPRYDTTASLTYLPAATGTSGANTGTSTGDCTGLYFTNTGDQTASTLASLAALPTTGYVTAPTFTDLAFTAGLASAGKTLLQPFTNTKVSSFGNSLAFNNSGFKKRKRRYKKPLELRKVLPKNSLMLLHEYRPNVEYRFVCQSGPIHRPIFTMCVDIDEHKFEGTGKTKKEARMKAAEKTLEFLMQHPEYIQKSNSGSSKNKSNSTNLNNENGLNFNNNQIDSLTADGSSVSDVAKSNENVSDNESENESYNYEDEEDDEENNYEEDRENIETNNGLDESNTRNECKRIKIETITKFTDNKNLETTIYEKENLENISNNELNAGINNQ